MSDQDRHRLFWTGAIALGAWVLAQGLIWAEREVSWIHIPDGPVLAIALGVIAVTTFVGYYGVRGRIRTAIAASFLLFYLALLTFLSVSVDFRVEVQQAAGQDFIHTLETQVTTIIVFYFGVEGAVHGTKVVQAGRSLRDGKDPETIKQALDVDSE